MTDDLTTRVSRFRKNAQLGPKLRAFLLSPAGQEFMLVLYTEAPNREQVRTGEPPQGNPNYNLGAINAHERLMNIIQRLADEPPPEMMEEKNATTAATTAAAARRAARSA